MDQVELYNMSLSISDTENISPIKKFNSDLSQMHSPKTPTIAGNNNRAIPMDYLDSQLTGSPLKRKGLSDSNNNNLNRNNQNRQNSPGTAPSLAEHKKLERLYADSVIRSRALLREQEKLEEEIAFKDKQILQKTNKINILDNENRLLMNDLQNERALNELEGAKFREIKLQYEQKIKQLSHFSSINKNGAWEKSTSDQDTEFDERHKQQQETIQKLNKRIQILEKENELEINSKRLIIEELEFFKTKQLEVEQKYELVKHEYESLMEQRLMDNYEEEIIEVSDDYDEFHNRRRIVSSDSQNSDLSEAMSTPSKPNFGKSLASELEDMTISVPKRNSSNHSNSTLGSHKSSSHYRNNSANIRQSSLNKYLKDIEVQNLQQVHSQELTKLKFQLKSLQLQNEKLTSYIGFLIQKKQRSNDGFIIYKDEQSNDLSNGTNNNNGHGRIESDKDYEYSDEINIKLAKNELKTVIRSASALPIRPTDIQTQLTQYSEGELQDNTVITDNKTKSVLFSSNKMNRRYSSFGNEAPSSFMMDHSNSIIENIHEASGDETDYVELGDSSYMSDSDGEYEDEDAYGAEMNSNEIPYGNRSLDVLVTPMLSVKKRKKSKSILNSAYIPRRRLTKLTAFTSPSKFTKKKSLIFDGIKEEDGVFGEDVTILHSNDFDDVEKSLLVTENIIPHVNLSCSKHYFTPCTCRSRVFSLFFREEGVIYKLLFTPKDEIPRLQDPLTRATMNTNNGLLDDSMSDQGSRSLTSSPGANRGDYTYVYEKIDIKNLKLKRNIGDEEDDDYEYDSDESYDSSAGNEID